MILTSALMCLAMNIYHENRGDSIQAQTVVANVTMNRAGWKESNVCKTVMAKHQFSWTSRAVVKTSVGYRVRPSAIPKEKKQWDIARMVAMKVLRQKGSMTNATHFHRVGIKPKWAYKLRYVGRHGKHLFYTTKGTKHDA